MPSGIPQISYGMNYLLGFNNFRNDLNNNGFSKNKIKLTLKEKQKTKDETMNIDDEKKLTREILNKSCNPKNNNNSCIIPCRYF